MNPLEELQKHGQSIWLDYIRRSLITSGELQSLVENDGLRGVTSNPTIFEKAIAGSSDYDGALRTLLTNNAQTDADMLYEALAVEDIQMAADVLRPIYDQTEGADGFVSLEVSPNLAHDTKGTITEAKRLNAVVARPNVMIKVPATSEGIPAIEALTAEGININITLMFSLSHYEAVARAYIKGLERCAHPSRVASVASFFVSRVDTLVDRALEAIATPEALALRGRIAIANSKVVYRRFRELFYGDAFSSLRKRGARVQRPLWASTGTKNPIYSDVRYVEELIGADTVNTLPPATLNAFREHGRVRGATVEEGLDGAKSELARLKHLGVDLDATAEKLQGDGVAAFAASFNQLRVTLEEKRRSIIAGQVDRQLLKPGQYQNRVENRRETWQKDKFACRLWSKDPTLWFPKPVAEITDRLGWLTLPETMHDQLDGLKAFAAEVMADGIRHCVLVGMGGSSLAPEVFQTTFGNREGYPELIVLDSTHPAAVRAVEARVDLRRALFLVSSKSGTTTETLSFFRYFWHKASQVTGQPGRHFVAITDPDTPLERLARERGFRFVFNAPPDVGGRYSALTVFGLVPAALIGVDLDAILDRAWRMSEACAFCVRESDNPCLSLGAALGELALAGRDKVTFLSSLSLAAFPAWIEQLIAESTGKDGKGIVPVADEPPASPELYGADRVFVSLLMEGENNKELGEKIAAVEATGHPVIQIRLNEKADLGQEFFRWEVAVAAAGAVLGIHPFNQPDVQLAKELATQAMNKKAKGMSEAASLEQVAATNPDALRQSVSNWLTKTRAGDYVAVQAYVQPTPESTALLQTIRIALRNRLRLATTLGYGPRFLHSTGQLHKGGPNTALILQLVDEPADDLPVPETDYTFGSLIRAQAVGDFQALKQRGRRVLRIDLSRDVAGGLARLTEALRS
ncbi:MAG: bifunctional transaldolase/phosoglucose isomerase [Deltaproteobacteria bacterium]|nr:MAG: bifunctional transaldolase/phosoglucose isomerase [Deltaproteobacteria bacterium]